MAELSSVWSFRQLACEFPVALKVRTALVLGRSVLPNRCQCDARTYCICQFDLFFHESSSSIPQGHSTPFASLSLRGPSRFATRNQVFPLLAPQPPRSVSKKSWPDLFLGRAVPPLSRGGAFLRQNP